MKRIAYIALLAALICGCSENLAPVDYVDPMVGTGFHGHTYPGVSVPFGMVQLSPDTRTAGWDACSGYHYDDNSIIGFSHTHLSGTGCADLADVLFYPCTALPEMADGKYILTPHSFSHKKENASCGYYSVDFSKDGIFAELTATARTGVHRYTFAKGEERHIIIDLQHTVTEEIVDMSDFSKVSDSEIVGMRRSHGWVTDQYVYFSARFSVPIESFEVAGRQAVITFPAGTNEVTVAVGLSSVSSDNAHENSVTEVPELVFDDVYAKARDIWAEEISQIKVEGGTRAQLVNFYTSIYHSKLTPDIMEDVCGEYRRHDGTIGRVEEGRHYYSTLSLWDTFRAWNPLMVLFNEDLVVDMINSMLDMYDCTGELPIWPLASGETGTMIGYHAVSVIGDAYLRGIRGFDADHALEAMVKSSNINKKGSDYYVKYGYVPANIKRESIALTLEYAYDDWVIAEMAQAMGRTDIADEYHKRAKNYANVFDGNTLFFRGRRLDGGWITPFDTFSVSRDFTEATPWHYRFFTPHDVNGLIQLFGGKEAFISALDDLFTIENDEVAIDLADVTGCLGQYAHGNEPSHHMAYLYNYAGEPWKTQKRTRELLDVMYSPDPEGIVGNEDCGQMSAWYIFSALGFYPVCPGSGQFVMTSPVFDKAEITLSNGNKFVVKANNPGKNVYIKDVLLNGQSVSANYIAYEDIIAGGELEFILSSTPCKEWGTSENAVPYSYTKGEVVSMPYTSAECNLFEGSVDVDLNTTTPGAAVYYTLDGTEPDRTSVMYTAPVKIDKSLTLKAKAYKEGVAASKTLVIDAVKAEYLPAAQCKDLEQGVRYDYYEGKFSLVAEVEASPKVDSGVMPSPSIANAPQEDHYGYVFTGYVDVPEQGIWEFSTVSDDGSVLYIDGRMVVNNDSSHAAVAATGRIALAAGLHAFKLIYFEDYEGQELAWGWKYPSRDSFESIPEKNIFYKK